ncbi:MULTISPECIES: NPCBM/NEW2 domain-containing protein [unclassified Spirosoma]|uniref:NPCBM/NEW2 domain-containing protein n=1 Tax=unclassified Spirosoma TaxID=2621999 RepID=UPI000967CC31|nr:MULTISPECIES: NPCBM/NEW2 domain-containing protein [unclassified Spirosoma]MBN8821617.1 NPCBM/NEW2 domain-containing protein [Spirosoma sp.]OJW78384.1 MAG: alpha-galactosidase [Spirosoma sp. 48-14]
MPKPLTILLLFLFVSIGAVAQTTRTVWLDDLEIQTYSEGLRPVKAKHNYQDDTLRTKGVRYSRGLGAQSPCVLAFALNKQAKRFSALVGPDDQGNKDIALTFYVLGDGKVLFESREMRIGDAPVPVDVDLTGIRQLGLLVTDKVGGVGNKRTYCNWIDARVEMIGNAQIEHVQYVGEKYILTPPSAKTPKINSAKIVGVTPNNPFLYYIAATGNRPMTFSAESLPAGLSLDAKTGIISGKVAQRGTYAVTLKAKNALGTATKSLTIKIGDTIALTPPIGWNGWNSWEAHIDREKVIASADAMVKMGLRDHGWTYINIDDAWQGKRGGPLNALQPNAKFPRFKEMVDYIHSLGLKAGLYSTPYISSYGGYAGASSDSAHGGETHETIMVNRRAFNHIGKYRFEVEDAKQMAEWGFDFLKYDWRIDVNSTERMSTALKQSGRDIVFSLSNNAPFEKVTDWARLSNMYRTGPDIKDSWTSLYLTTFSLDKWAPYTAPGHWADPDMMILGKVSIGPVMHDTRLLPDEQYSHVSIFSLLAAPMLIGCPIEQLDAFTLNLLTNDDVIEINQDPLGKPARLVKEENGVQIWAKPLEDGSVAVGLFNTAEYGKTPQSYFYWGSEKARSYTFDFASIGLKGKYKLRDVWRQKDLGTFDGSFNTEIRHHGVVMLRLYK